MGAIAGAVNTVNPLYGLAMSGTGLVVAIQQGDWEGGALHGGTLLIVGVSFVVGGGAEAGEGAESAITNGSQVTEQIIRNAMEDAPLASQQSGGISLPLVQEYVNTLLAGDVAPAIKVDENIIVDGNHRYVAGRILGMEPEIQPWSGGDPTRSIPWSEMPISPNMW